MIKVINTHKKMLILAVIILLALGMVLALRVDIKTTKYYIKSNKISDSVRTALVTDLHSCNYGEHQQKLLNKIFAEDPDFVLLGGDIVDDKLPQKKAEEFLAAIAARYPCFYVTGNHEYWSNNINDIKK